jgi:Ankyrin repeats (3 copies)
MPVRSLPPDPNLDHLRYQAKDLIRDHAARKLEAAQRLREFHPLFRGSAGEEIFATKLSLSAAQLAIAREYGFRSWTRLKAHVEQPELRERLRLPHHERIDDPVFRGAVDLLDAGDSAGLRIYLRQHPQLAGQRVVFEGGNYFRNPTLLEFIAENPIRNGTLPKNVVDVAKVILDAGVEQAALDETLMLVSTGRVVRECRAQIPLIDLLCSHGATAGKAMQAALLHGELEAMRALIRRGAAPTLAVAAALGEEEDFLRLLPAAGSSERHLALAMASQYGRVEIVRLLLDAGEDPGRYNPVGAHSHATPLHQAAGAGCEDLARLLIERGARADAKDLLWHGTPADWARHEGRKDMEAYLREREAEQTQPD